jgi:hypothetical protein
MAFCVIDQRSATSPCPEATADSKQALGNQFVKAGPSTVIMPGLFVDYRYIP